MDMSVFALSTKSSVSKPKSAKAKVVKSLKTTKSAKLSTKNKKLKAFEIKIEDDLFKEATEDTGEIEIPVNDIEEGVIVDENLEEKNAGDTTTESNENVAGNDVYDEVPGDSQIENNATENMAGGSLDGIEEENIADDSKRKNRSTGSNYGEFDESDYFYDDDNVDNTSESTRNNAKNTDSLEEEDTLPDMMHGENSHEYETDRIYHYSDHITSGMMKNQTKVKKAIVDYADNLEGHFTSPYRKNGRAVAIQCCAYVNQVWHDVFGTDLYSLAGSATDKYSYDGESAYEFFERVGLKTGDVIYTRYQKTKKNSRSVVVTDKNGNPIKTMGQHFLIILDYDEEYVWYTDGYESRTNGFVVSSINRKVKYEDSKYFRNVSGSYADIEGAYFERAGKRGTRYRYYRLPESKWVKIGGKADILKAQRDARKAEVEARIEAAKKKAAENAKNAASETPDESKNPDEDIDNNRDKEAWEYTIEEISANKAAREPKFKSFDEIAEEWTGDEGDLWISGLENLDLEHDGEIKEPEIRVFTGIKCLEKDTDYTVEYTDNLNAGIATVWIKGQGKYRRRAISENFIIRPYDLEAHYEEGNVLVKPVTLKATGRKRRGKPIVKCMISMNSVSSNSIKEEDFIEIEDEPSNNIEETDGIEWKLLRLKAGRSCVYAYNDVTENAYIEPSDIPYYIYIEGMGNFTGVIKVEEYLY